MDFELWYVSSALSLGGVIRWPSHSESLERAEVERLRLEFESRNEKALPERVRTAFQQAYSAELLPERRPAVGRVLIADDGRIWVERFEPIRLGTALQTPGIRWTVLEDTGEPVAILALSPMVRLEDVRADKVVVVRRDSLDVQTVAMYRLKR